MTRIILTLGLILGVLAGFSQAFCAHGWGGIGEYHKECPDSAGKKIWDIIWYRENGVLKN